MTVRAKFHVTEVTNFVGGSKVSLMAVSSGSEENKQFFKYTPNAKIEMSVLNEEAAKQFQPGDQFYVDFIPAPKG